MGDEQAWDEWRDACDYLDVVLESDGPNDRVSEASLRLMARGPMGVRDALGGLSMRLLLTLAEARGTTAGVEERNRQARDILHDLTVNPPTGYA